MLTREETKLVETALSVGLKDEVTAFIHAATPETRRKAYNELEDAVEILESTGAIKKHYKPRRGAEVIDMLQFTHEAPEENKDAEEEV